MSDREAKRAVLLAQVAAGTLTLVEASALLSLSYRQGKRLWQRFRVGGAAGIVHRGVGQPSHRAYAVDVKERALAIVAAEYGGSAARGAGQRFGPTLAAEYLARDHALPINAETLRRWMLARVLWSPMRKHAAHRTRRERRAQFGGLVQMDGSFHNWVEGRQSAAAGERWCLITMIDDATNRVWSRFSAQETIWDAARVLREWIAWHGVPVALYTDKKTVYVRPQTPTEQALGIPAVTAFGGMCARLDIAIIAADSPQAKGRVERSHGTDQDRLIKAMRIAGISTMAEANVYLRDVYLPDRNGRLTVPARNTIDAHRVLDPARDLRDVYYLETTRRLGRDWIVQYATRLLQVTPRHDVPTRAPVSVRETEDGELRLWYTGRTGTPAIALTWEEVRGVRPTHSLAVAPSTQRATGTSVAATEMSNDQIPSEGSRVRQPPSATHPFRKFYPVSKTALMQEQARIKAGARPYGPPLETPLEGDRTSNPTSITITT